MRKASLVGFMTAALLQGCAGTWPPAPEQAPEAARLPPFEGEHRVVVEPLRGITKVDLVTRPTDAGKPDPQKDLWARIRKGFAMPDLDNALVRRRTREYAASSELQRMFDRSRIYLYHIVEEIEKRGLPTELALLPMVESQFNPMARSPRHASGLWQFVPGTGKRFDLKQNSWYDGRRDIVDSTDAALDYLTALYQRYGDWQLVLASYNWGENAVGRAIARNRKAGKPTDYASLKMPAETRNYVPKLQALKNIIAEPSKYGIDLAPIPNERYFTTVLTGRPELDVALAAKLAEMPVKEFKALNPGFSRPLVRSPKGLRIVLPSEKVAIFHENLAKLDRRAGAAAGGTRAPKVNVPHMHRVEPGDTLSAIARRYDVRLADLRRWNPGADVLQIGQNIYLEAR
ncbi:MAG TPA: transglycosylase SLT domain-containing protein [Burkholderiales bacterium]|jgi:membrane-bound lytic murein transglycosylase D